MQIGLSTAVKLRSSQLQLILSAQKPEAWWIWDKDDFCLTKHKQITPNRQSICYCAPHSLKKGFLALFLYFYIYRFETLCFMSLFPLQMLFLLDFPSWQLFFWFPTILFERHPGFQCQSQYHWGNVSYSHMFIKQGYAKGEIVMLISQDETISTFVCRH